MVSRLLSWLFMSFILCVLIVSLTFAVCHGPDPLADRICEYADKSCELYRQDDQKKEDLERVDHDLEKTKLQGETMEDRKPLFDQRSSILQDKRRIEIDRAEINRRNSSLISEWEAKHHATYHFPQTF